MSDAKTSTFTLHHNRCAPGKWTAHDILALANFVRTGDMIHAAYLSRHLGLQLVLSEHHAPKGGVLEEIGYADPKVEQITDDLDEICEDDLTQVVRVYRGPVEYAVRFAIGNEHGELDGHEIELFKSEAEAEAFLKGLHDEGERQQAEREAVAPGATD